MAFSDSSFLLFLLFEKKVNNRKQNKSDNPSNSEPTRFPHVPSLNQEGKERRSMINRMYMPFKSTGNLQGCDAMIKKCDNETNVLCCIDLTPFDATQQFNDAD